MNGERWEVIERRDDDGETAIYVGTPELRGVGGRDYRMGFAEWHACRAWDYQTACHIRDTHNATLAAQPEGDPIQPHPPSHWPGAIVQPSTYQALEAIRTAQPEGGR